MAAAGIRLVTADLCGVEVDVDRGTKRVVGIEDRLDGTPVDFRSRDGCRNTLAGHVGQFLVHELGRVGAALTDETALEPLSGDALELSEEMKLGFFMRVAPFRVEQPLGQKKEQGRASQVVGVKQIEVDRLHQ